MPLKEKKKNLMPLKEGSLFLHFHDSVSWYNHFCQLYYQVLDFEIRWWDKDKERGITSQAFVKGSQSSSVSAWQRVWDIEKQVISQRSYSTTRLQNSPTPIQSFKKYTQTQKWRLPPHNPICGKIKLIKFQLKNTSFVYFLGGAKIH